MPESGSSELEKDETGYRFEKGQNWTPDNVRTIIQWIHICSINLDIATESAKHYKVLLRRNTIMNLIFSTFASTASLSQFNISQTNQPNLYLALNILFTVCASLIALGTGFIKIYQVQEKLEKSIKLHQEWTSFGSMLSSELQLPLALRKDALYLIIKYKDSYTELFKQQSDVSNKILARVAKRNGLEPHELSLSELFERLIDTEAIRLKKIEDAWEFQQRLDEDHRNYLKSIKESSSVAVAVAIDMPEMSTIPESSSEMPSESSDLPAEPKLSVEEIRQASETPDTASVISTSSTVKTDIPKSLQNAIGKIGNSLIRKHPNQNSQLQLKRENMSKLVMRSQQRASSAPASASASAPASAPVSKAGPKSPVSIGPKK